MSYGIKLIEFVGITRPGNPSQPAPGSWLMYYDPEAYGGQGDARWTWDPARALPFDDPAQAIKLYRAIPKNKPVRDTDGRPNRPLTSCTISVEKLP